MTNTDKIEAKAVIEDAFYEMGVHQRDTGAVADNLRTKLSEAGFNVARKTTVDNIVNQRDHLLATNKALREALEAMLDVADNGDHPDYHLANQARAAIKAAKAEETQTDE